jgi:hypothetical protein
LISLRQITIVSGGQTGADRAALDFAIEHGVAHRGWCPRDRQAEDGTIDACYQLRETPSRRYVQRTQWNVRDSDATLVFTIDLVPTGGTALTIEIAQQLGKPLLHLARPDGEPNESTARKLLDFLSEHQVQTLNVAGPRASQEPDVAEFVRAVLTAAWDAGDAS